MDSRPPAHHRSLDRQRRCGSVAAPPRRGRLGHSQSPIDDRHPFADVGLRSSAQVYGQGRHSAMALIGHIAVQHRELFHRSASTQGLSQCDDEMGTSRCLESPHADRGISGRHTLQGRTASRLQVRFVSHRRRRPPAHCGRRLRPNHPERPCCLRDRTQPRCQCVAPTRPTGF